MDADSGCECDSVSYYAYAYQIPDPKCWCGTEQKHFFKCEKSFFSVHRPEAGAVPIAIVQNSRK